MKSCHIDSPFRLSLLLAVAGVTLLASAGCGGTQGPPPQQPPPEVTVATPIRKQIVEWDEYTGRLEAIDYVEIRSRVSGYLQSIHFDEGQMIEKNDLLFVIDPRPFQAELNGARSDLTQAESQLAQARATLEDAKARLKQSEAQRQLVETQVQRVRKLRDQNAATQDELDQYEAEYLTAEADVSASNAGISSAEATIETAKAGIESAKARVEAAELNLEYTRIYAPVSGRISRQMVTEGNLVSGGSASSTLLTTITSVAPIYCYFDATEQEVLKYTRLAQSGARESSRVAKNPVFLALVDEDGFPHLGHMDFVDNRFDANTASMRARCVFPNDDQVLIPGMFARIRIPGSAPYQAILIPDSAIGTDQSTQFVYLVNEEGIVEQRTIKVGPIVDGLRVVREGLAGSEILITEGLLQARPEMQVVTRESTIESDEDGLPDTYEPLPPDQWISPNPDPLPEFTRTGRNLTADKEGGN